jgi:hypothetical protein
MRLKTGHALVAHGSLVLNVGRQIEALSGREI